MNIAYVRVSTLDQHEGRQIEGLKKYDIEKWFIEKISGKNTDRPQLQAALDFVREGDTFYVHDFSRLARNTRDLLEIADFLKEKGARLVSNKENVDTDTPTGKLMFTMIAALAEFERTNLLERQREGIEIAKAKGVYKGRKPVQVDNFPEWYKKYKNREISKTKLAEQLHISRPTLDKLMRKQETEESLD